MLRFAAPAAIVGGAVGLLLYALPYAPLYQQLQAAEVELAAVLGAIAPTRQVAQTALVTYVVLFGLLLVLFIKPPNAFFAAAAERSPDRRPARLALGLMVVYLAILYIPTPIRALYQLTPLGPVELGTVLLAVGGAALLLRWVWRSRLFGRARAEPEAAGGAVKIAAAAS